MSAPVSYGDFVGFLADRYAAKADMARSMAEHVAETTLVIFLDDNGVAYGDPGLDWTRKGANDMADEDMSNWDGD